MTSTTADGVAAQPRRASGATAVGFALAVVLSSSAALADGGLVRLQQVAGPYLVTVFAAEPLRAGSADLSVLVQSQPGGEPVLDATVDLVLRSPNEGRELRARATHEAATNRLLQAALIELPEPGTWKLRVEVRRGEAAAEASGELAVAAPPPRLSLLWPYFVLPAAAVALFAVGQWLSQRRAGKRGVEGSGYRSNRFR